VRRLKAVRDALRENAYSWDMTMKDGRIVKVVAFFDTRDFTEFWNRVTPKKTE